MSEGNVKWTIDIEAQDALDQIDKAIAKINEMKASAKEVRLGTDIESLIKGVGDSSTSTGGGGSPAETGSVNAGGESEGGASKPGGDVAGETPDKASQVAQGVMMGRLLRDSFGSITTAGTNVADVSRGRKTTAEAEYEIAKASADAIGTAVAVKTGNPMLGMGTTSVLQAGIQATPLPDKAERARNLSSELKSYGKMLIQQGLSPSADNMRSYADKISGYVKASQASDRLANKITDEFEQSYTQQLFGSETGKNKLKRSEQNIKEIQEKLRNEMGGADCGMGLE